MGGQRGESAKEAEKKKSEEKKNEGRVAMEVKGRQND